MIHPHGHIGLFRVRQAEHRGQAKLALHHLARRGLSRLPGMEQETEPACVLRLPSKHSQSHRGENTEAAFRAHHHLIDIRPGGAAWVARGLQRPARGGVLLRKDDILYLAVVGRILPCATRDHPAAHTGMQEGLRKVPAGIAPLCFELLRRSVKDSLQLRSPHSGLHSNGLVYLVESQYLVHVLAHIKAHPATYGFHTSRYGGATAIDIERELLFVAIGHQSLHLGRSSWCYNRIRQVFSDVLTQAQRVDHACSIRGARACISIGEQIFFTNDPRQRL